MTAALACLAFAFAQADADILATFEVHPDFELQLVAREPLVFDPVDIKFDERGRAFVVEMPGYPFPAEPGKLVMLTDSDGDGVFDTRKVFAEGFEFADSVLPYRGGFLVASPPDILFLKDTDGDDVADVQEVVMGGFASDNTQHNFNGLTLGLDGWIYGANGGNSGSAYWADTPEEKTPLRWNDFRLHMDRRAFELIGRTSGGFGIGYDPYGRIFTTHNTQHINQIVFPGRFIDGLPVGREQTLHNVSDHEENGLSRIYAIGEQETRVNHPEQSGYFSGACGINAYTGGAFGPAFEHSMFVCDVVLNLVHVDFLSPDGAAFKASRHEERREFLASTDRAFRPVNSATGPDGALYITDMYRAVIEHPEWIPDEIEVNLDLEAGKDKGRIYRIVPKGGLKAETSNYSPDDLPGAVAALGHKNMWHRMTAQRLLVEWNKPEALSLLEEAARNGASAYHRLHAMWTLDNLGKLSDDILIARIADEDAGVRENALQIAEARPEPSVEVIGNALEAAKDPDPRVRLFAVLTMDAFDVMSSKLLEHAAHEAVKRDVSEPWIRMALLSAYSKKPIKGVEAVVDAAGNPGAAELARALGEMAAKAGGDNLGPATESAIKAAEAHPQVAAAILEGMAAGLAAGSEKGILPTGAIDGFIASGDPALVRAAWRMGAALGMEPSKDQLAMLDAAGKTAMDSAAPAGERLDALALFGFADFETRKESLFALLDTRNPRELQVAAIQQLQGAGQREVAERLIAMWDTLGPDARSTASNILIYQRGNNDLLLSALEDGRLKIGQLNLDLERRRVLLFSRDESIKARAEKLFSDAGVVTRKEAIEKMRPALTLAGDAIKGKAVFAERCITCHQMDGEGAEVGPVLTEIFRKSRETLLHDILDPNAAVDTQYLSFTVETASDGGFEGGEVITGMIVAETDEAVTLRQAGGAERTIRRADMASMRANGLSMMPEELEAGLDSQGMADLLAYLQTPR